MGTSSAALRTHFNCRFPWGPTSTSGTSTVKSSDTPV